MLLRLTIPTLTGASFSLSLLYLLHYTQTTHQHALTDSLLESSETLRSLKHKRDDVLGVGEGHLDTEEGTNGLTRSRFQPRRNPSLGQEVKHKWNTHLTSLTSTLSTLNPDDILLSTLATFSYWSSTLFSSLSNVSTSSSSSSSSNITGINRQILGDKHTVYAQDAKHSLSLRTPQDRAALAKEKTGLDASPLGVKRI